MTKLGRSHISTVRPSDTCIIIKTIALTLYSLGEREARYVRAQSSPRQ